MPRCPDCPRLIARLQADVLLFNQLADACEHAGGLVWADEAWAAAFAIRTLLEELGVRARQG